MTIELNYLDLLEKGVAGHDISIEFQYITLRFTRRSRSELSIAKINNDRFCEVPNIFPIIPPPERSLITLNFLNICLI
jgi:hypothetical protein